MKLKLKESPGEWTRFALVLLTLFSGLGLLLWWRGLLPTAGLWIWLGALLLAFALLMGRPGWRRGVYRAGMSVSFRVGMFMGRVLLTLFYLGVLTPMAVLLRLMGKDLLGIKPPPKEQATYWKPARKETSFERMS
jgi:hypothetical protein